MEENIDEIMGFAKGEIVKLKTGKVPAFIPAKVQVAGIHYITVRDNGGVLREEPRENIVKADASYQAKNADWF